MKKISQTIYVIGILLLLNSCGELESGSSYGYSNISSNQVTNVRSSSNTQNTRYNRDSLNEIVIDNDNKLIWQDDIDVVEKKHSFSQATQYCKNLNTSSLKNWRLPKIGELSSLIDENEDEKISQVFQNHTQTFHLSSDNLSGDKSSIWGVHFQIGFNFWMSAGRKLHIRCVADLL